MDRNITQKMKGIAICLMVIHHLFMAEWHISSAPYVPHYLSAIAHTCKICVSIYCFLTGYGYAFAKKQNLRYSIGKCVGLLKHYWLQLGLLFIPVALANGYEMTLSLLIRNLFGLSPNLNFFAWYVYFYIFAMLILPFFVRLLPNNLWISGICGILACYVPAILLHSLPSYGSNVLVDDLFNCLIYFPGVILGYLCAKHKVFEWLDEHLPKSIWWYVLGAMLVPLCRTVISSIMGLPLDVYYAPVFVYCCYRVLRAEVLHRREKILSICGKYSTQIWFFHAVFFSIYIRDYCQWILWLPRNPILVFIWCMILCLGAAKLLELLTTSLDKMINRCKKVKTNA